MSAAVAVAAPFQLRPYQREAIDAITAAWARGLTSPAIVLPTGTGKTEVFAWLIAEWLERHPGRRAVVVAHRTELIEQAHAKVVKALRGTGLRVGRVQGTTNETLADVVVASVLTLKGPQRLRMLRNVGLIVIDECHHATAASYRAVLDYYSDAHVVGVTATMTRGDDAALGDVWQDVVYQYSVTDALRDGWLVRPRGLRVYVDSLDMSHIRVNKATGDYRESDLGQALEHSLAPEAIAAALRKYAPARPAIVFCPTVASAEIVRDAIRVEGFAAELISGKTPKDERKATLLRYRAGRVQVLVNCMVLTEGTDLPMTATIVIGRATTYAGLYIQMAGRGLRLDPNDPTKTECLIIDVVGASQKHALTAPVELFGEEYEPETEGKVPDDPDGEASDDPFEDPRPGRPTIEPELQNGPLGHVEVDLFHGSASAWMRTYAGYWFLRAGERYIVIVPGVAPGTYDVTAMHKTAVGSGRWVNTSGPLRNMSYAMACAEGEVEPSESTTSRKDRSWRAKAPSPEQCKLAVRLGLTLDPFMTAGQVGAAITVHIASGRIDPKARLLNA